MALRTSLRSTLLALALVLAAPAAARAQEPDFGPPQQVTTIDPPAGAPWLRFADDGSATAVWRVEREVGPTLLWAVRPAGTATSFSTPRTVAAGAYSPSVAIGPRGEAVAAWLQVDAQGSGFVVASTREAGAQQWSAPRPLTAARAEPPQAAIADDGSAVVAWRAFVAPQDGVPQPGRLSVAGRPAGGTWSSPAMVTEEALALSAVAAAPGGAALVSWAQDPSHGWAEREPGETAFADLPDLVDGSVQGPRLAYAATGDAVALWSASDDWGDAPGAAFRRVGAGAFVADAQALTPAPEEPPAVSLFRVNDRADAAVATQAAGAVLASRRPHATAAAIPVVRSISDAGRLRDLAIAPDGRVGVLWTSVGEADAPQAVELSEWTGDAPTSRRILAPATDFADGSVALGPSGETLVLYENGGTLSSAYRPPRPLALGAFAAARGSLGAPRLYASMGGRTRGRVTQGRRRTVSGRLVDAAGRPMPGARLTLGERVLRAGAGEVVTADFRTTATGSFKVTVRSGPSRALTLRYLPEAGVAPAAERGLRLDVRPRIRLTPRRRVLRGRLFAGPFPRRGKRLEVQLLRGGRWVTARRVRTRRGRFSVRRLPRGLYARVRSPREAAYPYLSATSVAVRLR